MHVHLLLAVFAVALGSVDAIVTQVAIHRVPTNAHVSPLKAKLSKWHAKWANADKNDDPVYLDMMQGLFVANVTVGTPPQPFLIGLDTGSSDFWLIDATCKSGACKGFPSAGHQRNLFNKTISTTYVDTDDNVQICYVDGSCTTGVLGYDTIRFGAVVDTNQSFGVMSFLNDDMGYMSCDGIFGAAWPSVSSFGVEPPLQRVLNQLDKPLFSVWLDKHPKASPTYTGLITYGALDAKNCEGSWNFLPLLGNSFWNYELDSFSLGTKKLRGTSGQTVTVDTGTSWLNFPNTVVDTIVRKLGAEYDYNDDLYYTDCFNIGQPDFVFRFGGQNYALTSDDYLLSTSSGRCAVKVYPQDLIGGWLVGDTFIRRYCHAFDIGGRRIGLAKSKQ